MLNRRFLTVAGIAGLAVIALFKNAKAHGRSRERVQHKVELNRWEGEGGNLPPSSTPKPDVEPAQ